MLSKSRIVASRQCQRRLWLEVNRPQLRVYGPDTRRRFAQGHRLNEVVYGLYPNGRLIGDDVPLAEALRITASHLGRTPQRPLFEATFSKHRVLVRADIFHKVDDGFRLTEVKSSTRVKPHHLIDCAIQNWVITQAGYPVSETVLAHIDTGFRYRGDRDYGGLLRHADVAEPVAALVPEVKAWVHAGLDTLAMPDEPDIDVGPHCRNPFACPFIGHCTPRPAEYPVSILPGGGRIVSQLQAEGIGDVRDIPAERLLRPLHRRVYRATLSGRPFVGAELATTLQALPFPRHYLDFESIQFAVPRWADTHPYEQLPFQWSCHIEPVAGELQHREFLDSTGEPPMRRCAQALIETLGRQGTIFTYSPFEKSVIDRLAARYPDLAQRLRALVDRLFDLLPLVKANYYHPAMKGSYSIKAVLPTIAPDLTHADLGGVKDGVAAQIAYETLIDCGTPADRRHMLAEELRQYCRLDTLAMVRLVRHFEGPAA
jgi:predicted RecB family nuclease